MPPIASVLPDREGETAVRVRASATDYRSRVGATVRARSRWLRAPRFVERASAPLPVAVNVKLHGVRVIVRPLAVDVEAKEVLRRRHMRVMDVDRWQSQHLAVCVRREESPRIDPDGADGELCGELGRVHPARRVPLVATAGERADALERPRAVGRGRLAELEVDRRWRRAH
eukprot:4476610-Prymnesium_polylepis.5